MNIGTSVVMSRLCTPFAILGALARTGIDDTAWIERGLPEMAGYFPGSPVKFFPVFRFAQFQNIATRQQFPSEYLLF